MRRAWRPVFSHAIRVLPLPPNRSGSSSLVWWSCPALLQPVQPASVGMQVLGSAVLAHLPHATNTFAGQLRAAMPHQSCFIVAGKRALPGRQFLRPVCARSPDWSDNLSWRTDRSTWSELSTMSRRTPTLRSRCQPQEQCRDYVVVFQDVKFSRLGSPVGLITNTVRWISVNHLRLLALEEGPPPHQYSSSHHTSGDGCPKSTHRLQP